MEGGAGRSVFGVLIVHWAKNVKSGWGCASSRFQCKAAYLTLLSQGRKNWISKRLSSGTGDGGSKKPIKISGNSTDRKVQGFKSGTDCCLGFLRFSTLLKPQFVHITAYLHFKWAREILLPKFLLRIWLPDASEVLVSLQLVILSIPSRSISYKHMNSCCG